MDKKLVNDKLQNGIKNGDIAFCIKDFIFRVVLVENINEKDLIGNCKLKVLFGPPLSPNVLGCYVFTKEEVEDYLDSKLGEIIGAKLAYKLHRG